MKVATLDDLSVLAPEVWGAYWESTLVPWREGLVDPVLLELARLRLAQNLRCEYDSRRRFQPAIDRGLDETKIAYLPSYYRSTLYSELERLTVAYAELFLMDPHGIDDAQAEQLVARLGEAGFVSFSHALGAFETFQRLVLVAAVPVPTETVVVQTR